MRQQPLCSRFEHIEHAVEVLVGSAVGIRHLEVHRVSSEFHEQLQLAGVLARAYRGKRLEILPVHGEHVVELDEVAADDLPSAQPAQVIAAPDRGLLGPQVGRVADVEVVRPGRIDLDPIRQSGLGHLVQEHPLRARRPADVAGADEQHSEDALATTLMILIRLAFVVSLIFRYYMS